MQKGIIFDIQRNSFVDGPGIRTTVFFKGCNLRCKWCHNPESQSFQKEILFYKNKCTDCGEEYTDSEVLKDKSFYETSGGGVTFSGGECMLQIDFLYAVLKKCKENGIHTAIDTAGHIPWESFEKIMPYTDLYLYDIKCMNSEIHKKYTGVSNTLILENLAKLLQSTMPVWIRIPVIPDANDTESEIKKIRAFFDKNGYPQKIELLPYHAMGEHKYAALGRSAEKSEVPDEEKLDKLKRTLLTC